MLIFVWGMCMYIGESEMHGNCDCMVSISYTAGFGGKVTVCILVPVNAVTGMHVHN